MTADELVDIMFAKYRSLNVEQIHKIVDLVMGNKRELQARVAELEAFARAVERNAPIGDEQPENTWKWVMWVSGKQARALLAKGDDKVSEGNISPMWDTRSKPLGLINITDEDNKPKVTIK